MILEGYHSKGWGVVYSQESIERVLDYIRDGAPAKDEPPDSVCGSTLYGWMCRRVQNLMLYDHSVHTRYPQHMGWETL